MRSIKELLEIMLQHKHLFYKGLCFWGERLELNSIITKKEGELLYEYIKCNRPDYFSWTNFINKHDGHNLAYFFPCDKIKPRIHWIKRHIKRLKQ